LERTLKGLFLFPRLLTINILAPELKLCYLPLTPIKALAAAAKWNASTSRYPKDNGGAGLALGPVPLYCVTHKFK
jgi:hypothetical protein